MIETAADAVVSPKAWQQLPAAYEWDDLVLPARQEDELRTIAAEFSAHGREASGAQAGRPSAGKRGGIRVLLSGPAGTGKTMAALALGHELRLRVIEADLTSVLTRERWRMARLFAIAGRYRAVLAFDHFDTLLAGAADRDRAGEAQIVNDLPDLLERSARHPGILICATRLAVADETVLGHFDHVIEIPFPNRAAREEIWRRQLANTHLGETDIPAVASALTMSGRRIAARGAAAKQSAGRAGVPLQVEHVVRALAQECAGEELTRSGEVALAVLRARATGRAGASAARSRAGGSPDRDRPTFDPPARSISPPARPTSPAARPAGAAVTPADQATVAGNGAAAAPGRTPGHSRFSPGDTLAGFTRALGWLIAGLAGVVAAAALGLALAGSGRGGAALPALDQRTAVGPVIVSYPSTWQKSPPPALSGIESGKAVAFSPVESTEQMLMVGRRAGGGPALLPAGFAAASFKGAAGQAVRLGSMWFYRFPRLPLSGDPRPASVYALPTTAGLVLSVCRPPSDGFVAVCERILGALKMRPGVHAVVSPRDYVRSLNGAIARLNAARASTAPQLAAARTATGQSRAESQLATAHAQAATVIAKLDAGPAQAANAALASALRMTAAAYAGMARAAAQQDATAYQAANSSLAASSAAVGSAFADLEQFGFEVS